MDCGRCFKCREGTGCIRAVSFAPSAMPNRHPGAVAGVAKDKTWEADMPAYQRLRRNGVQPKRIDDSAALETRANDQFEVEMAQIIPKHLKSQVKDALAITKEMEIAPSSLQKKPGVKNA